MNAVAETKAAYPVLAEDYRQEKRDVAVSIGAISVCGSFEMVEKLADLSIPPRRPTRRPVRTAVDTSALLSQDPAFLDAFHNGVTEIADGKSIAWDDLKKELGL
jgi:hypothetical protein